MIFLRLAFCPFRCVYCDEPEALLKTKFCTIFPLDRSPYQLENPLSLTDLLELFSTLCFPARTITITGGEPLYQSAFLEKLLPSLKAQNFTLYLETAGFDDKPLKPLLPYLDMVSLDWKFASHLPHAAFHAGHQRAIHLLTERKKAFMVKMVLTEDLPLEEVESAAEKIAYLNKRTPVILQPVTPFGKVSRVPSFDKILKCFKTVTKHLEDLRVIPQTHKLLNIK